MNLIQDDYQMNALTSESSSKTQKKEQNNNDGQQIQYCFEQSCLDVSKQIIYLWKNIIMKVTLFIIAIILLLYYQNYKFHIIQNISTVSQKLGDYLGLLQKGNTNFPSQIIKKSIYQKKEQEQQFRKKQSNIDQFTEIIQSLQNQEYNPTSFFNLWNILPQQKETIFISFKQNSLKKQLQINENDEYILINYGKNQEFNSYKQSFENHLKVINWIDWSIKRMNKQEQKAIEQKFKKQRIKRFQLLLKLYQIYHEQFKNKKGFINDQKLITYKQFLESLQYSMLTGYNLNQQSKFHWIYLKEKKYYQQKYQITSYQKEIDACIIAQTHNNVQNYRYAWHIQSLLQQQYLNFKVIIIDDNSDDNTGQMIAKHLSWRKAPKEKFILLKTIKRNTALENIYYAIHKYCDYNQIILNIDGDDQLIGTQVFKLYNALYQKYNRYIIYSNYFSYDYNYTESPLALGLSQEYLLDVVKKNKYRTAYHAYSHLRSMISDIFLLQKMESLKNDNGTFYWTIADNAMMFPALQMSCGKVLYIPQMLYWYNANTGFNDWRTEHQYQYLQVKNHITRQQRHYHCIDSILKEIININQRK